MKTRTERNIEKLILKSDRSHSANRRKEIRRSIRMTNPERDLKKYPQMMTCRSDDMDEYKVNSIAVFDKREVHENCTVEILRNSVTGEESIGWYENNRPPKNVGDE